MYADAASDTAWQVVTYQPSSSEPPQLVLSSAYSGVFIVDF
jgi:hypothetical protein